MAQKLRVRVRRLALMVGAALSVAGMAFLLAPAAGLGLPNWAPPAMAADAKPAFAARIAPTPARAGENVVIEIAATIPAGYHLYSMTKVPGGPKPLTITVDDPRLGTVGPWFGPSPEVAFDSRFGKAVEQFAGEVVHRRSFAVSAGAELGSRSISVGVNGQICSEKHCIGFREVLPLALAVETGAARQAWLAVPALTGTAFHPDSAPAVAGPPPALGPGTPNSDHRPPLGEGFWSFLLLALLAGLGALATPCVFPMIPITVSYFSKYAKISVRQSAAMAAIYAVSIIFCFTIIGVAVSVLFGAVGMQSLSSSAAFNIFLFVLLVGFSFNLFGLFEINMPSGLIARTSAKERELTSGAQSFPSQAVGVFLMAVTFTLVSFTCTVGFVGVVLAQAAKGHWFFPAIGMLAFSFSFSIPFFCLAMFPSWANKLRGKSGDWMVAIKVMLGFLELAGALKFLSNVDLLWHWGLVTRPLVLALWSATFLTAALYLFRLFNLPSIDGKSKNVGPVRMVIALLMFAFAIYSSTGIRDTKSMGGWLDGWLPPAVYPGEEATAGGGSVPAAGHEFTWIKDDLEKASAMGRTADRPVFVDFTGYTCTNCRYMESSIFPRREVADRLHQMVLAQAFTDCDEPVCNQQRDYQVKHFDTAALPFYVILNPYDGSILATFASSTNDAGEFTAFLQTGLDAFAKAPRGAKANAGGSRGDAQISVVRGAPAVDFSFSGLADGKPWRLSQLRGQWTLVNFWASWCGPCLKELKEDFPAALDKAPWVNLVTVAFEGAETKPAVLAFVKESRLLSRSITLFGPESVTGANLDAGFSPDDSLPATYLIAPDGQVAWTRHGSVQASVLDQVLAQTQPRR